MTNDLETFHFNRAVARVHELSNALADLKGDDPATARLSREGWTTVVQLIGPIMPHLAEELWLALGHATLLADSPWPVADPTLLVDDTVKVAVQVSGKLRGTIELPRDAAQKDAEQAALALPAVTQALAGRQVRRIVFVPNKIINVVG